MRVRTIVIGMLVVALAATLVVVMGVYGASRSDGGLPIIALPATALGGKASRIVATLKHGAGVTTTRNHVRYVVTEHGVASLYGKTIRQRAQALIDIAAPEFREDLERAARELKFL